MAYDPRTGTDTAPAPTNTGGRSQPQTAPTPGAATADVAPRPPPPTQEQIQAAAAQGMAYHYDAASNSYQLRAMTNTERGAAVSDQLTRLAATAPDMTGGGNTTTGASAAPAQAPAPIAARSTGPTFQAPAGAPMARAPAPGITTNGPYGGQAAAPGAAVGITYGGNAPSREAIAARMTPGAAPAPGGVQGANPSAAAMDYSRYDKAAQLYQTSIDTFQSELGRLSGVDPFGNQAFLRQATDRAIAQAGGLAAGGLSTATARAGNMRQAQGVQAQMAAQGRDQAVIQRNADEVQASQQRIAAAGGLANTIGQQAENEVQLSGQQVQVGMANLDAAMKKYGIDAQLKQQDVDSLRQMNVELQKLGEQGREADMDALVKKYGIDQQTYAALKEIAAKGKLTFKDVVSGIFTAGAGLGAAAISAPATAATKAADTIAGSDRRFKFDVRDPDLRDLEDFLGRTKGKLYRYREPNLPGRRAGLNFGPMAQDLAKSKIGKTVVVEGKDGLYVDTSRLALADHAALAALAAEVKALKSGK